MIQQDTYTARPDSSSPRSRSNVRLAFGLFGLVAVMVGLSYAAVPLYQIFCQVTGYGGTTQRVDTASTTVIDRAISVRFDASISPDLDWSFRPVQQKVELKIGENALAFYKAVNVSGEALTGTASFNVTPEIAGSYFSKVDCFCFTEQTLQAHQSVDMPVSFYVDPAIMDDPDARKIEEITLSYTFFRVEKDNAPSQPRPKPVNHSGTIENTGRSG